MEDCGADMVGAEVFADDDDDEDAVGRAGPITYNVMDNKPVCEFENARVCVVCKTTQYNLCSVSARERCTRTDGLFTCKTTQYNLCYCESAKV
jgi:hypothetical protein